MSPKLSDSKLNHAALVIAKLLLLRTREGKVQWEHAPTLMSTLSSAERYGSKLEDDVEATISRDGKKFTFTLSGPPAVKIPNSELRSLFGSSPNEILSISLECAEEEQRTPEGIVYRDLQRLFELASNPKAVSDDLRIKQVMSYLDKLGV